MYLYYVLNYLTICLIVITTDSYLKFKVRSLIYQSMMIGLLILFIHLNVILVVILISLCNIIQANLLLVLK